MCRGFQNFNVRHVSVRTYVRSSHQLLPVKDISHFSSEFIRKYDFLEMSQKHILEPEFRQFTNRKPVFGDHKSSNKVTILNHFWIFYSLGPKGHPALRV